MADINNILFYLTHIVLVLSLIILFWEILYIYKLRLGKSPKWLANLGYRIDKFLVKREIGKAVDQWDVEKMETVLIKATLNKLSSPDLENKILALTEIKYYTRKLSSKNRELVTDYLIDVYKTEDNTELKKLIIRTICRLVNEKSDTVRPLTQ